MSGTSLALKLGSLIIGAGIFFVMFKKVKGLKKYGLVSLLYVLAVAVILSCSSLFLLFQRQSAEVFLMIWAQMFIVMAGLFHVWLAPGWLPWYKSGRFGNQIVFVLCILMFAYFFSNLFFSFFLKTQVQFNWQLSMLWFIVPVLLSHTVSLYVEIPEKEFIKWKYPLHEVIQDPTDEEMENLIIISFIFLKSPGRNQTTKFSAKAPVGMTLGRLFYFFINDYNGRFPEDPITFADHSEEPDQWIFYKLVNRTFRIKVPLDPDESVYSNNIRENNIILCSRFKMNVKSEENETN